MSVIHDRELIKKAYPHSKTWPLTVDKMSERQVVAILLRFKREGKI